MIIINLYAAWIGILLGAVMGAVQGSYFHKENWLGGYGTWARRMTRLGHISLFGIAFINLAFYFTSVFLELDSELRVPSVLFIIGAIGMPLNCYLSAFWKRFRHLFFIPTLSVIIGAGYLLWIVYQSQSG